MRIPRDPLRYEGLEWFDEFCRDTGITIDTPDAIEKFSTHFGSILAEMRGAPSRIAGLHVNAMFEHLAWELGHVHFIKQEDAGNIRSRYPIQSPDFRVQVEDGGAPLLIEVKSTNAVPFRDAFHITRKSFHRYLAYATAVHTDLMFAVFWRRMGAWTLVKPNAFAERGARCELDAQAAFGMNHMNMLGDVALATRTPLRLKIEAASNNAVTTEDGVVSMVIGAVRLFSRYGEIIENAQKRLALFMMMYGRWRDAEPRLVQDADGVTSIEAEFDRTPEEADPDAYGVGWLSILYSRMFSYYTLSPSGDVRSFRAQPLDGGLQRFVPKNYPFATARLPLLILEIPPSAPLVYREQ